MQPAARIRAAITTAALVLSTTTLATNSATDSRGVDLDYLFSAQFLYALFIFQDRLPEDPFVYSSPEELYEQVDEPYTMYIPKKTAREILQSLTTETSVFGVVVDSVNAGYVVQDVFAGSPADSAGLRTGDTLLSVNGQSLATVSFSELSGMLRGKVGARKRVLVARGQKRMRIKVVMKRFMAPSVLADSLDSAIAYIHIMSFLSKTAAAGGTVEELARALERTEWAAMTILDLRDNAGGELEQALQVTDEFLPGGAPMVHIIERAVDDETGKAFTRDTTRRATAGGLAVGRDFVILMNGETASASELLIAAVTYNRPDVVTVGTRTFGKGRGQIITVTPDSGLARVTFALLEPVSGKSYDLIGIQPKVPVTESGTALNAALNAAQSGLSRIPAINEHSVNRIEFMRVMGPSRPRLPLCVRWRTALGSRLAVQSYSGS